MTTHRDDYLKLVVVLEEIVRDIRIGDYQSAKDGEPTMQHAYRARWEHVTREYAAVKSQDPVDAITSQFEKDHFDALKDTILAQYPNTYYLGVN